MSRKLVIARSIEVVALLFSAFGHFLIKWAPPEGVQKDFSFVVGFASVMSFCLLLFISSIHRKMGENLQLKWLYISLFLFMSSTILGVVYMVDREQLVVDFDLENGKSYVVGTEYTSVAQDHIKKTVIFTKAELIGQFEEKLFLIWTEESIYAARKKLILEYVIFTLLLSGTVFSLVEGAFIHKDSLTRDP